VLQIAHAKKNPRRAATLRGFALCSSALTLTVEPLANIVANYACYDGQQEIRQVSQVAHLPPLPGFSEEEGQYHEYTKIRPVSQGRENGFPHQCAHWFGMTRRGTGDGRRAAEGGVRQPSATKEPYGCPCKAAPTKTTNPLRRARRPRRAEPDCHNPFIKKGNSQGEREKPRKAAWLRGF
jgi:hypothetical protein